MSQDHVLAKTVADVVAVSVTAASLMQWLPPIAAALSIVWLVIQIADYIFIKRQLHTKARKFFGSYLKNGD